MERGGGVCARSAGERLSRDVRAHPARVNAPAAGCWSVPRGWTGAAPAPTRSAILDSLPCLEMDTLDTLRRWWGYVALLRWGVWSSGRTYFAVRRRGCIVVRLMRVHAGKCGAHPLPHWSMKGHFTFRVKPGMRYLRDGDKAKTSCRQSVSLLSSGCLFITEFPLQRE